MLNRLLPALGLAVAASLTVSLLTNADATGASDASLLAAAPSANVVTGPSGLPVPRFVALRKDRVHARFGPSFEYPVAYEFNREGLPLKVIAEDRDDKWRRVEDRDGRRMWIHRSMLAPNAHAVVAVDEAVLRAQPRTDAQGRAKLTAGVMAKLETCEAGWCRLKAGEFRGWLPREQLWGADI